MNLTHTVYATDRNINSCHDLCREHAYLEQALIDPVFFVLFSLVASNLI